MTESMTTSLLDVYHVACLAGGAERVVDTALVVLLEGERIRVERSGVLSLVSESCYHPIEAAVLDAVGVPDRDRSVAAVRRRACRDVRVADVEDRLCAVGLLTRRWLVRACVRPFRDTAPTASGRDALRGLRTEPSAAGITAGGSALQVALEGPGRMADPVLRAVVFEQPAARRRPTPADRRAGHDGGPAGWMGIGFLTSGGGDDGGGSGGHGGHGGHDGGGSGGHSGCGGSSGCGGGGCGGSC